MSTAHDLSSLTSMVHLQESLDVAFAGLPPVRDDSHFALLGAADAIRRFVMSYEPDRPVPPQLANRIYQQLYPFIRPVDAPFPRYFSNQAGNFGQGCLYLRCDDKQQSVFVMDDGAEVNAGPGCNYGACVHMCLNGSWQELTEADAKAMLG